MTYGIFENLTSVHHPLATIFTRVRAAEAPRPPLAQHAKLRHDLARKREERSSMRRMSPHERLQILRAGFLPSGALERHFAVRAEVRQRVRTRQRSTPRAHASSEPTHSARALRGQTTTIA